MEPITGPGIYAYGQTGHIFGGACANKVPAGAGAVANTAYMYALGICTFHADTVTATYDQANKRITLAARGWADVDNRPATATFIFRQDAHGIWNLVVSVDANPQRPAYTSPVIAMSHCEVIWPAA